MPLSRLSHALLSFVLTLLALLALGGAARADSDEPSLEPYDQLAPYTSWRQSVRLDRVPLEFSGAGTTVAVLDTGVVRHPDLGTRVKARVDLSPDADGIDRFGHGAHMTGLVAGDGTASGGRYQGAAPGAGIVSVKAAGWNGATDVSVILAGLEWIGAHAKRYGIRVVNLSYGTDSSQKWREDPLNRAVERLWDQGILVVVGAGNRGEGGAKIEKPGDDPLVLTVGAADTRNTATVADDVVAPFSSRGPTGDDVAKPDVVAPGVSLPSLRVANGFADLARPAARLEERYFKGTGTSQATAIVSGIAARMLHARPGLTPDELKATLMGTTSALRGSDGAGAGLVDAAAAVEAAGAGRFLGSTQRAVTERSSASGSLDGSRGEFKPYTDYKQRGKPEQLSGEYEAFGAIWDRGAFVARPWDPASWLAAPWRPYTALAAGWAAAPPPRSSWGGMGWDENSWSVRRWGESLPPTEFNVRRWGSAMWN